MRFFKFLAMMTLCALFGLSAAAETGTLGQLSWSVDGEGALVISGSGPMEDLPAGTSPWGRDITSAVLEEGVESLGAYAFYQCKNLQSVSLPEGLRSIGRAAFLGCESLQNVLIPSSVQQIGDYAFDNCKSLTGPVCLPEGIGRLGAFLFYGCESLAEVRVPSTVQSVGMWAFYGCASLERISLPDSIDTLGSRAFLGCPARFTAPYASTTALTLGRIGSGYACPEYPGLELRHLYRYDIPAGLAVTGADLTADIFTIPPDVTAVWNGVFDGSDAEFHALVESPGARALGLTGHAFRDTGDPRAEYRYDLKDGAIRGLTLLHADADTDEFSVPHGVTDIADQAFMDCDQLRQVTLPKGLLRIGDRAFSGCGSLEKITLPDTVTQIGWYAFYGCSALRSLRLSESLTAISRYAFFGCRSLTEVIIPASVTEISRSAFSGCSSLVRVQIPAGVTRIGSHAFYNCQSLAGVDLPPALDEIADYTFYGCGALTSLALPESILRIQNGAFSGCSGLTDVAVPRSVTQIGSNAFAGAQLTSVTLPCWLEDIHKNAFPGNEGMTVRCYGGSPAQTYAEEHGFSVSLLEDALAGQTFTLPLGLASVESAAFLDTAARLFILPETLSAIAEDAFSTDAVLSVPSGSFAETWARTHGYDAVIR